MKYSLFLLLFTPFLVFAIVFTVENVDIYNADKATISVDLNGYVYLVGNSSGGRDVIRFIQNTSGSWNLDSVPFSAETGINYNCRAASVLDTDNHLHIVYRVNIGTFGWPVYTNNIGGSFLSADTLINNSSQSTHHYSIALDSLNRAHIICEVYEGTTFKIVYYIPAVDSELLIYNNAIDGTIAVDKNNIVHIAFGYPQTGSKIYYTNNSSGSFSAPLLVSDSSGRDPSIAVDNSGFAHICWAQSIGGTSPSDVFYSTNKTGAFVTNKVVTTPTTSEAWAHISLSKDNHVGIVYNRWLSSNTSDIVFAHKQANDSLFNIDTVGQGHWNSSYGAISWNDKAIAIDTMGYIHLVYTSMNGSEYAKSQTPIGCEEKEEEHALRDKKLKCWPNPFNNIVQIIADGGQIEICDNTGRVVRNLDLTDIGMTKTFWNGTDQYGIKLPAGIYFVVLRNDAGIVSEKVLMLK